MFRYTGVTFLLLVSICLFGYSTSYSQDMTGTIYAQFETGFSGALNPDIKLDDVLSSSLGHSLFFGGGAAYQLSKNMRADFTITYRGGFEQHIELGNAIKAKADFQSTAFMFNGIYDFSEYQGVTPYVSGGLGYVANHLGQVAVTQNDLPLGTIRSGGWSNLGIQLGGGITFPFYNNWAVDVGYRFFHGGKYESSDFIIFANGSNQPLAREVGTLNANEIVGTLRIRIR